MQENYHTILNSAGVRPSVQRVAVYSYLCEHPGHPTVEEIYGALSQKYPTLSKTTLYNTFKLFEEKHLIQTIYIDDDRLRFDADTSPHSHFKCRRCGKIFDLFNDNEIIEYKDNCVKMLPQGFKADKIQTNIWGICSCCAKNN